MQGHGLAQSLPKQKKKKQERKKETCWESACKLNVSLVAKSNPPSSMCRRVVMRYSYGLPPNFESPDALHQCPTEHLRGNSRGRCKLPQTIESKPNCQGQSFALSTTALGRDCTRAAPWAVRKPISQAWNPFFIFHANTPFVSWGSQSWCLARKKHGQPSLLSPWYFFVCSVYQVVAENSLSLRWCELSSRKEIEGGRRRPLSLAAQRQFVQGGWTLADLAK